MNVNVKVLERFYPKFGVAPIVSHPGVVKAVQSGASTMASHEDHNILLNSDYEWEDEENAYKHIDNKQFIYYFDPGKLFVWVWENKVYRTLKSGDMLNKWVSGNDEYPEGKSNTFIKLYLNVSGQSEESTSDSKTSEADKIINKIMMGAKIKTDSGSKKQAPIYLPSDEIIDLYHKSKEIGKNNPEDGKKLMDFIKTLKPMPHTESIKKSHLETLIREIIRGVIKEVNTKDLNQTLPRDPAKYKYDDNYNLNFDKMTLDNLMALKQKSARFIADLRQKKGGESSEVYLKNEMDNFKRISAEIKRRLDYINKPVDEMTTTAAVAPVMTPKAFKKKSLSEMNTTDGGTPGYNVPGAFSRRGGSKAGVAGSETLGYTLTNIGKKEMDRPSDKLI